MGDGISNGVNGNSEDSVQAVENPVMHESVEEVSDFPLERCLRIMPHDQNTGAFFIAVLQKISPLTAIQEKPKNEIDKQHAELENQSLEDAPVLQINSSESAHEEVLETVSEANVNDNEPNAADLEVIPVTGEERDSEEAQEPHNVENNAKKVPGKRKLQIQGKWRGVDPVLFFKDETIINSIRAFYAINEHFPFSGHFVTRNNDTSHVKRIYYVSKSVKDVLELNFSVGQQLKITSIGLKMFERPTARDGSSAPLAFRISSEGLPLILPYITKQILHASPVDFKRLLQDKDVKFSDFVDTKFGEKAAILLPGCCVVVLGKGNRVAIESLEVDEPTIAIGCWRGRARLLVMVTALDRRELLEKFLMCLDTEKSSFVLVDKPPNNGGDEVQPVRELNSKNDDDVETTGSSTS